MNKKDLIEISDNMFKTINYYVIQHDFKLEVYNVTNGFNNLNLKIFNGDRLEIMTNFISHIFGKVITQTIIKSLDKTITVFVRDKKELK
ncbi:MAG TPA: hypothetical protein VK982_07970 [Bacteroidales bacterium]|nr:hypothetical protein [Bacteroidales bacterium]